MNGASYRWVVMAAAVGLLCSCAHVPRMQRDVPVAIPESYGTARPGARCPDRWWTSFKDERLNDLVSEALGRNFSLSQARHRLEQAHAVARRAGAEQVPRVTVEAGAARLSSRAMDGAGGAIQVADRFDLSLAASYEVDLWGRVGATERAAILDAEMARDGLETAAMTVAAHITDAWVQLGSLSERLALLREQIAGSADHVRLLELRFDTGHVTALDVWRQREQLAALRALSPRLEASIATTRHHLAVLVGRPPRDTQDLVASARLELPPLPDLGLPADLLEKRPDVRAALKAVRAADERVAAALADRLPALRLATTAGYSASDAGALFNDWLWTVAGNLLGPVLDGSRRRAETERARAAARERLARCGDVLLNAMREVEDALVNEARQSEVIVRQTEQHEAARQTLYQARHRYRQGLTDYLSVLNARERAQSLERAFVSAKQQRLSYRIQLYRSLGGHWTRKAGALEDENDD